MKLKTMMAIECGEVFPLFDGDGDAMPAFEHDAAAAHALMIALGEHVQLDSDSMWSDERERVLRRADEILAEWEFADGR